MNPILITGVALAVSLAGNLWLFNSRDNVLKANATLENQVRYSDALSKQCNDSVEVLEKEAAASKKANAKAVEAARRTSQGKQAAGQQTLSTGRSVPTDECASIDRLVDDWYTRRAAP